MSFSGAKKPAIAFICKLKKQVRLGLVLFGEGQSAISDRAGVAHLKSQRNRMRIQAQEKIWFRANVTKQTEPSGSGQWP